MCMLIANKKHGEEVGRFDKKHGDEVSQSVWSIKQGEVVVGLE